MSEENTVEELVSNYLLTLSFSDQIENIQKAQEEANEKAIEIQENLTKFDTYSPKEYSYYTIVEVNSLNGPAFCTRGNFLITESDFYVNTTIEKNSFRFLIHVWGIKAK